MSGTKNRRQGTAVASAEPLGKDKEVARSNGSAQVAEDDIADEGPRENIFLLWPNIIGTNFERTVV
jgi:CDP-diacylglycerol--inositol 3-phosphatidyltransferase